MNHVPATFGVFLLAAAVSASVHAQEAAAPVDPDLSATGESVEATDLDSVIVTGTRSPKAVDKIPGAVTVVSKEELQHTLLVTEDATAVLARTVPGYAESSQAMSNSGETLRGRIALRLFDGIPQGSPLREGGRNATFTDMGIIGRVEVINGPSASEGVGASGGIINYLSKVPTKDGSEVTVISRYSTQSGDDSEGWKLGVNYFYKQDSFDFVGGASFIDRGISYDADGRRIGMNTSGSVADSEAKNLFLKAGINFGEDGEQRLQATVSQFKIEGQGNYIQEIGCRPEQAADCGETRTNTSVRGHIFGSKAEFNDFEQYSLTYNHADLFGGSFDANLYKADQAMRYLPENGPDKQDPLIAPVGTLYDQSEIDSKKSGLRTSWARSSLFGVSGLELRTGIDLVRDEAQQRLALTNRLWVPPMEYKSTAPYAQLTYDIGPVTLSGGLRHEDGDLHVDDYTTVYQRDRRFVSGGTLSYQETLKNFGAIWRMTDQWSVFASYGEGFGLPNVGIPLRNIQCSNDTPEGTQPDGCPNDPPITVQGIFELQAVIVDNREFGVNWRGEHGSFSASHYDSKSEFGTSLAIDPVSNDFVLNRAPTRIKGIEISGDWKFNDAWKISALYSRIRGKTAFWTASTTGLYPAGGLNKQMGVNDISPDKFAASVTWKFMPQGDITLGMTRLMDRDIDNTDVRPYDNQSFSFTEHTQGYTLFDLGANFETERFGKFSIGIENLTNKQYILSWSQVDFFQNYWAGRGRMISFTHQISF
jgi:iron complex outermembrane recepter protein